MKGIAVRHRRSDRGREGPGTCIQKAHCEHARRVARKVNMVPLDQLRVGQRAAIASVEGADALLQRLLEMGLLEGEELEVVGVAPFGDPIEIRLRDYRLSLRRAEAARVLVSPLS